MAGNRTIDHTLCAYRNDRVGVGVVPLPDDSLDFMASNCLYESDDGEIAAKGHKDARTKEASVNLAGEEMRRR